MSSVLDVAKITSKGQVTIPASVRRELGVESGDRLVFVIEDDGRIALYGSNLQVLHAAQGAFAGRAAEAGLEGPDDVVDLVREIREERGESR